MKLGTQTASLVNHIHSRSVVGQPAPVAGMAATILHWTDRSPATIFRVFTVGKTTYVEARANFYERTDKNGLSESQEYTYKTNVNGSRYVFKMEKNGTWTAVRKNEETGRWIKSGGPGLRIGRREKYHDFSF
jgi:hypothetical protein